MFLLQDLSLIIYTLVIICGTLYIYANVYPQLFPCPSCPPCPPSRIIQKIIRPYIKETPNLYTRNRKSSINSVKWINNNHCDNIKQQFTESDNINFIY